MKSKIVLFVVLFLLPMLSMAQDNDMKKLFNKYRDKAGFEMETEDPDLDINVEGDFDLLNFLDDVKHLYILNFNYSKGSKSNLDAFKSKLDKVIEKNNYKSMIDISGEGMVKILLKKDSSDATTDFLMITEDEDDAMFFWASK